MKTGREEDFAILERRRMKKKRRKVLVVRVEVKEEERGIGR